MESYVHRNLRSGTVISMPDKTSRRQFIKQATVTASAAALAEEVIAQTSSASATGIPTRVLGKTGQRVSIVCLGGWHIGSVKDESEAIRIMHAAKIGRAHV